MQNSRKNIDYQLDLYHRIDDLPFNIWRSLVRRDSLLQDISYLRLIEEVGKESIKPLYILAYDNKKPVGALMFQLTKLSGKELHSYLPEEDKEKKKNVITKAISCILNKRLPQLEWNLLVSGNVFFSGESGIHILQNKDYCTQLMIIDKAYDRIKDHFKDSLKISGILLSDINEPEKLDDSMVKLLNFTGFKIEPDMFLKVNPEWTSFDDYMQSLSSKYRVRTKKIIKNSKDVLCRKLSAEEVQHLQSEINDLYKNVTAKASFNLANPKQDYFYQLCKNLEFFEFYGYFLNDVLIGFNTVMHSGETLEVHIVGLDYQYVRSHSLYQKILLDNVRYSIESGKKIVHYGRTAAEIKSTIGAKPVTSYCYVKHANSVTNLVVKPVTNILRPKEWTQRDPFKQSS